MELSCRPELNHPWGARFIRSRDSARPDLPNGPDPGSCWDFHQQRHPVRAWPPGSDPGQVGRGLGWPGRWMGLVGTKPSRSLSGQPSKHRPVAAAAFAARALTKGDPVGPTYNNFSVWNSRVGGPILVAISWPDLGGNCGKSCRERLWFFVKLKIGFVPLAIARPLGDRQTFPATCTGGFTQLRPAADCPTSRRPPCWRMTTPTQMTTTTLTSSAMGPARKPWSLDPNQPMRSRPHGARPTSWSGCGARSSASWPNSPRPTPTGLRDLYDSDAWAGKSDKLFRQHGLSQYEIR